MAQQPGSSVANPFQAKQQVGGMISVEQQRAVAAVQAAMIVARSMPRNRALCEEYIINDCTDPVLAEEAQYEYSRGGTKITGPSIRLLETVARRWGNMESGVKELERHDGVSTFEAYAWDMETNFRDSKVFQVKHWRDTRSGGHALTDERDIYELGANMGARRKRACMEAVIPTDIIRKAERQCELTMKTKIEITPKLISELLERFADFSVTKEMIQKRIQRNIETITPGQVVTMKRIFNSIRDGMSVPSEWFEITQPDPAAQDAGAASTGAAALKEAATRGAKASGKKDEAKKDEDKTDTKPPATDAAAAPADTGKAIEKATPEKQSALDEVYKLCQKALAVTDKAIADVVLDDARDLARSLSGSDNAEAKAAIQSVMDKLNPPKAV